MKRHSLGALSFSALLASLFVPGAASAAPIDSLATSSTLATAEIQPAEVVVDLGNYDPTPIAHPAYAITKNAPLASIAAIANLNDLVLVDDSPTGPSPTCPAPTATYDWDRVFSKSDEFGNNTFGAGYWAGLTFSSRAGRAGGPDTFRGEAMAKAYATVFGSDKEIAKIFGVTRMGPLPNRRATFVIATDRGVEAARAAVRALLARLRKETADA